MDCSDQQTFTQQAAIYSCDSPGSTFTDSSLIVSLFVVQLIVCCVFAFGSSCNHGPWLIPISWLCSCCAPRGCTKERGQRQIGYVGLSWKEQTLTPPHWLMGCISIWIVDGEGQTGGELRVYTSQEVLRIYLVGQYYTSLTFESVLRRV